jgi:transcriptional pleiotropic regulator of transition state genes
VIPIELRRTLDINEGDTMEVYTEGEAIIIKKHVTGCIFCSETNGVIKIKGKDICNSCKEELIKK